jgi:toxin ParE1/3/4
MTSSFTLREAAQADLEDIWLYTFQQWGIDQADSYVQSLLARCEWLSQNPLVGKKREDLKVGYYCFPEGVHLIFYTINQGKIDVIGILHQNMDITIHLY